MVKKTDYETKVTEIENELNNHNHDKHIDTQEFNTLAADVFNARLKQANFVTKTDFDDKLSNLNRKITSNKTKHVLAENELKKLETFDLSYFIGKNYFEEHGAQNYLAFQPMYRYFKVFSIIQYLEYVSEWKSKELSSESIKAISTSDNSLNPTLSYYDVKTRVKFTGSCLKQSRFSYTHGKVVNICIVYELDAYSSSNSDPTLKKCLFGAGTLTKNADVENMGILVMTFDLIEDQVSRFLVFDLVKRY